MLDTMDVPIVKETDDRPDLPNAHSPWRVYLKPYWLTLYLNQSKLIFGLVMTLWYLAQFIGSVACVNLYSDIDGTLPCTMEPTHELSNAEKSREVFDLPLLLLSIFHIIEWLRATFLLTVILIGVNWAIVWYVTAANTLYGIICYAFVHMVYFGDDGKLCGEVQLYRYQWLMWEIIAFWVMFFFFAFPFVIMFCRGKTVADELLKEAYEKQDEQEED